ncbi:LCCL domain-containing protein [Dactylosporangium sp. NPDC005572]|uniref:LCCL domain-containing protein n=1 Tax=Dactylosporangium sp. NPDC005572 TaxID=3156889 RepID=UPI0033B6A5DB
MSKRPRHILAILTLAFATTAVAVAAPPAYAAQTITWGTTAVAYRGQTGPIALVCPAGGAYWNVYGTGTYTDDSYICTAAVHAGVITYAAGGPVSITPTAGTAFYVGTIRYGVSTFSWPTNPNAGFTIAGATTAPGEIDWARSATEFRGRNQSFTFVCQAGGGYYSIYGTDTYTDDSRICTAAVHAGRITYAGGGTVTVTPSSGLSSYTGTVRNGVTSYSWPSPAPAFTFS